MLTIFIVYWILALIYWIGVLFWIAAHGNVLSHNRYDDRQLARMFLFAPVMWPIWFVTSLFRNIPLVFKKDE